ncbi:MAG: ABC transporter ATP-binding protein [Scrofimicrobium sp.]
MTECELKVTDLHVRRGHSLILQGVSLEVGTGVTGLIGRNGMGKTTLAEAIMGILTSMSGTISLDEKDLTNKPSFKVARSGIALVPQGRRLFPSLTVREHLQLVNKRNESEGPKWTPDDVIQLFPRLGERLRHKATQLSGGEQQMLAIGRALLQSPNALILDEPSEGLAPVVVDELGRAISELGRSGLSVLLVEQNLELITMTMSGEVLVMENGRITETIRTADLEADRGIRERVLGVALSPSSGGDPEKKN